MGIIQYFIGNEDEEDEEEEKEEKEEEVEAHLQLVDREKLNW